MTDVLKLLDIEPDTHLENVCDPTNWTSTALLWAVENDPDSFTIGRRNNDMVNWFFAKRLVELEVDPTCEARDREKYVEEFRQLIEHTFTIEQKNSLTLWNDKWSSKIDRLHRTYGHFTDLRALRSLWLPMLYTMPS